MASLPMILGRNLLKIPLQRMSRGMCTKEYNQPIKFSSSKAATWKAQYSRSGEEKSKSEMPWFQPYIIVISTTSFLVYFGFLREENDIDLQIGTPLHLTIDGMEEVQLRTALKHNLENGLPIDDIRARLREIDAGKISATQ